MIMRFKYGIEENNLTFGWFEKHLYRLPQTINKRFYSLKKLNQINIGNNVGYLINQKRFTIKQLETKTIYINQEVQIIEDKDVPF